MCDADGNVSATDVEVSADSVTPPGGTGGTTDSGIGGQPIPRTGNDVEPLLVAAAVALLAGTAFVLVARRRRASATA